MFKSGKGCGGDIGKEWRGGEVWDIRRGWVEGGGVGRVRV